MNNSTPFFSLQVEKGLDILYRDALFDINPNQTIGAFYNDLQLEYGEIIGFYYGLAENEVIAKKQDMDANMTLQDFFNMHGKKEEGAFFVEISNKNSNKNSTKNSTKNSGTKRRHSNITRNNRNNNSNNSNNTRNNRKRVKMSRK